MKIYIRSQSKLDMMKKYNAVLVSAVPNGKNIDIQNNKVTEYVGKPLTVCVIGLNNCAFLGYNVVVYDENMKSIIFDFGVIQELDDELTFTTKDMIYTFSMKS